MELSCWETHRLLIADGFSSTDRGSSHRSNQLNWRRSYLLVQKLLMCGIQSIKKSDDLNILNSENVSRFVIPYNFWKSDDLHIISIILHSVCPSLRFLFQGSAPVISVFTGDATARIARPKVAAALPRLEDEHIMCKCMYRKMYQI